MAVGVNALWVLLYMHAIERTELSRAVPIFQTVPLFGLIFAYLLLRDSGIDEAHTHHIVAADGAGRKGVDVLGNGLEVSLVFDDFLATNEHEKASSSGCGEKSVC